METPLHLITCPLHLAPRADIWRRPHSSPFSWLPAAWGSTAGDKEWNHGGDCVSCCQHHFISPSPWTQNRDTVEEQQQQEKKKDPETLMTGWFNELLCYLNGKNPCLRFWKGNERKWVNWKERHQRACDNLVPLDEHAEKTVSVYMHSGWLYQRVYIYSYVFSHYHMKGQWMGQRTEPLKEVVQK